MSAELEFRSVVKKGGRGADAKRVQEWLTLHGFAVKVDGDFGPASDSAARQFQAARGLTVDGVVGPETWDRLTAPLRAALAPIPANGRGLGSMAVAWARQQLAPAPREVGGDNMGPWVRLYMGGAEGAEWYWCAGFVSFCLERAAKAVGVKQPVSSSFSCDELAGSAKKAKLFLELPAKAQRSKITEGSIFLIRKADDDWQHTGIVVEAGPDSFRTIEGNTNDDGSRNGYGVFARTRAYGKADFILLG